MAQNSQKLRRGPGRKFAKGKSGNAGGRPKMSQDLRDYMRECRGPMTIKALQTTDRLLGSRDQHVAARVANDWLNKVLPDATHVEQQLAMFLTKIRAHVAPEIYELIVRLAVESDVEPTSHTG